MTRHHRSDISQRGHMTALAALSSRSLCTAHTRSPGAPHAPATRRRAGLLTHACLLHPPHPHFGHLTLYSEDILVVVIGIYHVDLSESCVGGEEPAHRVEV